MTKPKRIAALAIFALIATLVFASLNIYAQYLQIQEIGENFATIFRINLHMEILVRTIVFLFCFLLILVNTIIIRNNIATPSRLHWLKKSTPALLISTVLSVIVSSIFSNGLAQQYLLFANSEWFNLGDPVFGRDAGYYVFQRPFMMSLSTGIAGVMRFIIAMNIIAYILNHIHSGSGKLKTLLTGQESRGIVGHIIVSITLFFVAQASTYRFQAEQILTSTSGSFIGAGFTQIRVWLMYYNIAPTLLLAVVAITIILLISHKFKLAFIVMSAYPIFWLSIVLAGGVMQTFVVNPNELVRESQYIAENIRFTRFAYNLTETNVEEREFAYGNHLAAYYITENPAIINNLPIINAARNAQMLNELHAEQPHYRFFNSSISTYMLGEQPTAVYVTAREIHLPATASYTARHLRYTHGMGVVMNPLNALTHEGHPATIIKDINPTRSIDGAPPINQPRIYYGENTSHHAIVNTRIAELNDYAHSGTAGIPLNLANRLLFAVQKADFQLLISRDITSESRLLTNRNVVERARMALPFLTIDESPQIIVDESGNLKWILDGFTTSSSFPYSEFTNGINYIRNSVKIVICAYNGDVQAHIIDDSDPIIRAFVRMYPGIFESAPLPESIQNHMRFPERLFMKQASILSKYHATDPHTFFQSENRWILAQDAQGQPIPPNYAFMKIDGDTPEMVRILPLASLNRTHLTAMLIVRNSSENYGRMILYRFPPTNQPNLADTLERLETAIAAEIGAAEIGHLIIIPVSNSLLYIQAIYEGNAIKGIAVAHAGEVVIGANLPQAIELLFGINQPYIDETEGVRNAIQQAVEAFEAYRTAMQEGDWELAGRWFRMLEESMRLIHAYGGEL